MAEEWEPAAVWIPGMVLGIAAMKQSPTNFDLGSPAQD